MSLTGRSALATSLDAGGISYSDALVAPGSTQLTGTFEGLGNTISNLTIDASSNSSAGSVGLIGNIGSLGMVRDIGLIGGATTSYWGNLGSLAGYSGGSIANAYATGTVNQLGVGGSVGGLVGQNDASHADGTNHDGQISNVYATGAVTGEGLGHVCRGPGGV